MDLIEIIENYYTLNSEEKKAAIKEIFQGRTAELWNGLEEHKRSVLRIMADAGEKAAPLLQAHERRFLSLLEDEDPKTRMLTAQILGNCGGYTKQLIDACRKEQTMFILPSFLLAIGASKSPTAKLYLENYQIRSDLEKHIAEEKAALAKALANFVTRGSARLAINENDVLFLECPNADVTFEELSSLGIKCKKSGGFVLAGGIKSFSQIYKARTFKSAYLYLGSCTEAELPQKFASLDGKLAQRLNVNNYRLEVEGVSHQKRLEIIPKCTGVLKSFINTPSAYSFEIKLKVTPERIIMLLNPLGDKRFAYRRKAVSASVAASVAASVCRFCSKYFAPEARVLDNFCGSGTMLFERSFYPHGPLTGVDIAQSAVMNAKENEEILRCGAKFYHADALKFTDKQFDEIICNMPFGLRVSNHAKNEKLYDGYVSILPRIVKNGGYAFLYTNEKHLLEEVLRRKKIRPIAKATFEAGGLYPTVYVLKF